MPEQTFVLLSLAKLSFMQLNLTISLQTNYTENKDGLFV